MKPYYIREIKYNKAGRRIGKYKKIMANSPEDAVKRSEGKDVYTERLPKGGAKSAARKPYTMRKKDIDIMDKIRRQRPKKIPAKYRVITICKTPRTLIWTNKRSEADKRMNKYAEKNNKPCGLVEYY